VQHALDGLQQFLFAGDHETALEHAHRLLVQLGLWHRRDRVEHLRLGRLEGAREIVDGATFGAGLLELVFDAGLGAVAGSEDAGQLVAEVLCAGICPCVLQTQHAAARRS
jgi:hypothetical protein